MSRRGGAHGAASVPGGRAPLYEPLECFALRAPLLPVEAYAGLAAAPGNEAARSAAPLPPLVRRAIGVGSPALLAELERGGAAKAEDKLLKYRIRMATRPTPYGLFAGVAVATWGGSTDLALASTTGAIRTRPDMAWLLALVAELEARPEIRRRLCWTANRAAWIHAGRVLLAERAPRGEEVAGPQVSLRATAVVRRALELSRRPIAYSLLLEELMASSPAATLAKVEGLLEQLWQQTLLLSDLRPPLTTDHPARWVLDRLAELPEAEAQRAELAAILDAVAALDRLPHEPATEVHRRLSERAASLVCAPTETPFQVDLALELAGGRLARGVASEAARAAELLLRMSPLPQGLPALAAYRHLFTARYTGREVPLLELLHPELGLGPPGAGGGFAAHPDPVKAQRRSQTLLEIACGALRDRRTVVELEARQIDRLSTWSEGGAELPLSLDLFGFVAASSAKAVDEGDFLFVVGPNLGAPAAGRSLGRFADLLPAAAAALDRVAAAEQQRQPDRLWAELVYQPRKGRSQNVAVRPSLRGYEIVVGATPGVPAERVIPLDELVVGAHADRLYVRWTGADAELAISAGHMLNTVDAPAVCRFLSEVGRDGVAQLCAFDWGPAAGFPFLPRVQVGRAVLCPAQWRLDPAAEGLDLNSAAAFAAGLAHFRERSSLPRWVYLAVSDNRLLLDLEDGAQRELLCAELCRLPRHGQALLQEALPGPEHAWAEGPGGRYLGELVVSLVRRLEPERRAAARPSETPPRGPAVTRERRLRPPGSEWLFAKLYGPRSGEDDLITGPIAALAAGALACGMAQRWFFLRYADPEPHLRLRFGGDPQRLTRELLPELLDWGGGLVRDGGCSRLSLDTYEREVERYGGEEALAASEELFMADSIAVTELLRRSREGELAMDRVSLAVLTVDDLFAGLGLAPAERLAWCRRLVRSRAEVGAEFRQRKVALRALLAGTGEAEAGGAIDRLLAARREVGREVAVRLAEVARRGRLGQPLDSLYAAHAHLHCNRLAGDRSLETRALGLLQRTRESLELSALRPRRAAAPEASPLATLER